MAGLVHLCSPSCQSVTHISGLESSGDWPTDVCRAVRRRGGRLDAKKGPRHTAAWLPYSTEAWARRESPQIWDVKATGFLSPGPPKPHSIPFTIFHWASRAGAESNRGDTEHCSQCKKCQKTWGHVLKSAAFIKKANTWISP